MSRDNELNLMRAIARRLEKTEQEIAALEPTMAERIKQYLFQRYGWFARSPSVRPESMQ